MHDIPSYKLLPLPSIFAKLNARDPTASANVMALAENIAATRRAHEKALSGSFWKACKNGWNSLMTGLILYPGPYTTTPLPPGAYQLHDKMVNDEDHARLRDAWAKTGDDMRLAVLRYMDRERLQPSDLGLTPEEQDSLKPVVPAPGGR